MTRRGSTLIDEAVGVTGLAKEVIKNWIGNSRRSFSSCRTKKAGFKRHVSAYNMFCADLLKGKGDLKSIKGQWKELGQADREHYAKMAELRRSSNQPQTEEVRARLLKGIRKALKVQMSNLEDLGVEAVVLMLDKSQTLLEVEHVATVGALPFVSRPGVVSDFCLSVAGSANQTAGQPNRRRKDLILKVQELFNTKYNEAGGRGRFPYRGVEQRTVKIDCVGVAIAMRRPSYYGAKQLEEIIAAATKFKFVLGDVSSTAGASLPSENPEDIFLSMIK